jgi:hypothetical protein
MPLEYAATDLGWPPKRFQKAFHQLLVDGFVEYDRAAGVCLIVNALKWQRPENPNQITAAVRAVDSLPATGLLNRFRGLAAVLCPKLAERLTEQFGEPFAEPLPEGLPHSPAPNSNSNSTACSGGAMSETGESERQPLPTNFLKRV